MRLKDIQKSFQNRLLIQNTLAADNPAFRDIFQNDYGASFESRMAVYKNNIIQNLTEAVLAAFPMTEKLVGLEFLEQAVRAYVVQNLPQEGNLNVYGGTFPDFISTYEPGKILPYLSDFTRLEWLHEHAYYAEDDFALNPAELALLSEEGMTHIRFLLRASVSLFESVYPIDQIIDFCRADEQKGALHLHDRGCKILVYRPDLVVERLILTDQEYAFIASLKAGKSIYETVVTLSQDDPNINVTGLLQKYLELGVFAGFE